MKELLEQLIKIPSVSADKEACRQCLECALKQFEDIPVHIERQENNGVVSALVSTYETYDLDVLWLIHLDVVPAPAEAFYPVLKEGNHLYGRGALDMKSSGAVAICVLKDLMGKVPFKMGILFSTDEEVGGKNGASYWQAEKNLTAKVVLDPDSSQPIETIISKTKKPLFIKLTATGKAAHGSRPWLGKDANEALLQTIFALREKFPAYDKDVPVPNEGWVNTLHVGTIHGGTASNIIADSASAELDFRLIEDTSIAQVIDCINRVKPDNVSVEVLSWGNAVVLDQNNPVVSLYAKTVQEKIGQPVAFKVAFGATDGRYFAEKSIVLTHQATGANAHQLDEWIDLNSLQQFYEIQKDFLMKLKDVL